MSYSYTFSFLKLFQSLTIMGGAGFAASMFTDIGMIEYEKEKRKTGNSDKYRKVSIQDSSKSFPPIKTLNDFKTSHFIIHTKDSNTFSNDDNGYKFKTGLNEVACSSIPANKNRLFSYFGMPFISGCKFVSGEYKHEYSGFVMNNENKEESVITDIRRVYVPPETTIYDLDQHLRANKVFVSEKIPLKDFAEQLSKDCPECIDYILLKSAIV